MLDPEQWKVTIKHINERNWGQLSYYIINQRMDSDEIRIVLEGVWWNGYAKGYNVGLDDNQC